MRSAQIPENPFSAEEFKALYSRVPRLCVDLVVRTPGGVILTLRSLPTWTDAWHLPGGTVFYKETIRHAAKRVAKRELGIEVAVLKTLGYMEFPSEEKERGFGWSVSIALLCEIAAGTLFEKTDEASEIKAWAELPEDMIPEQNVFLTTQWEEIRSDLF
jgi:ADP-ribose pyrophosphatase YjhB (NUDIX family)